MKRLQSQSQSHPGVLRHKGQFCSIEQVTTFDGYSYNHNNAYLWRVCKRWSMNVLRTHLVLTRVEHLANIAHFKNIQALRLTFSRSCYIYNIGENWLNLQTLELTYVEDYNLDLSRLTKCHSLSFFGCKGEVCFRPKVVTKLPPCLNNLIFCHSNVHCLQDAPLAFLTNLKLQYCKDALIEHFPKILSLTHLELCYIQLSALKNIVDLSPRLNLKELHWYSKVHMQLIIPSNLQVLVMHILEVIPNQQIFLTCSSSVMLHTLDIGNWPKDRVECLNVLSALTSLRSLKVCGHCANIVNPNSECILELYHDDR